MVVVVVVVCWVRHACVAMRCKVDGDLTAYATRCADDQCDGFARGGHGAIVVLIGFLFV